ncbi:MAG: thioredoxin family protein [Bacteroidota bacterium]|nr:thioredoxin family protein [Bacteroidota bacterium]
MGTRTYSLIIAALLTFGGIAVQEKPEAADKILSDAYKVAASQKKNVFVIFHASWCGWCKKLEASINDPSCSDYFNRNYIFIHLTVLESKDKKDLENPGATEMYNRYAGNTSGIPFFLIFDSKGNLLADSKIRAAGEGIDRPGQNMGCPAADDEVAAFIEILRKTSKIKPADEAAISQRFRKNKS